MRIAIVQPPRLYWAFINDYDNFMTLHSMRVNGNTYGQNPVPQGWGYYQSAYDVQGSALDQPGKRNSSAR